MTHAFRLLVLLAASLLLIAGCGPDEPREIELVARDMSFRLDTRPNEANPVIPVRAGEEILVTLLNDAPGLVHDFEIPEWDVKSDAVRVGQMTQVTFTVPATPGRVEYRCGPHASMMHGFIEVTASAR